MNYRVHELAKFTGVTNNQMIEILNNNNIKIANHMSLVDEIRGKEIIEKYTKNCINEKHLNSGLLKSVDIIGLFNKYRYKIEFNNDICILVAENGFGKTTILNIIVAILNGDLNKVCNLPCEMIKFELDNKTYKIDIKKLNSELATKFRMNEYTIHNDYYINNSRVFLRKDYASLNEYLKIDYEDKLNQFMSNKIGKTNASTVKNYKNLYAIHEINHIINKDVLYYPTYRRIEDNVKEIIDYNNTDNVKFISDYVKFGMNDVEEILKQLLSKMSDDANNLYADMNASIIDDLLDNKGIESLVNKKIDSHKIEIVINIIGANRISKLEKLENYISGNENFKDEIFLTYYLSRLADIYDTQKFIDDKIKKYVDVCNKYLINKSINYNESLLTVKIEDTDGEELTFQNLSSGEKQIVSIFTKLYLETFSPIIFIIDEPEISLSIDWQKTFLEDIYNSGKVSLLIAATHSPFIFKNDYRHFTKELAIYRNEGVSKDGIS